MAIRKVKPTSPGRRFQAYSSFEEITTTKPEKRLLKAIKKSGGVVKREDNLYLWATYTSTVFRFVDDMEFRLVPENNIIHVRSGSRVGHSDLGVNRENVEKLRKRFNSANTATK